MSWRDEAACVGKPGEWWFPERDESRPFGAMSRARAICDACPVQQDCLNHALTEDIRHGMWGGKSPEERTRIRRGTRRGRPEALSPEQKNEVRRLLRQSGNVWLAAERFGVSETTIRRCG